MRVREELAELSSLLPHVSSRNRTLPSSGLVAKTFPCKAILPEMYVRIKGLLCMVVHTFDPSPCETKAGMAGQGQFGLSLKFQGSQGYIVRSCL